MHQDILEYSKQFGSCLTEEEQRLGCIAVDFDVFALPPECMNQSERPMTATEAKALRPSDYRRMLNRIFEAK